MVFHARHDVAILKIQRRPMDCAIHTSSAGEPRIRRIHDRVGFNERDITFFEPHHVAGV
jgi:hypothetical protein